MRKSLFLITSFLFIALVAFVYAIQYMAPAGGPLSIKHFAFHKDDPPVSTAPPVVTTDPNSNVQFEWKLGNPYLLKGGDGNVFMDLRVSGKALPNAQRKPMNLVLVIDRSGSMGSENKLEQVKNAATAMINNMNGSDRLAVVIYDDSIQTVIPSSPVENKEQLREAIYSLAPGGSTNLSGGLEQGFEEVRKNFRKNYVNRIVLLSDGLANVGVTDPDQIAAEAKQIRENMISVSTMGVGTDYNESLMANIADYSGGNYYYISRETNMTDIFHREWNLMQNVVATNARASFRLSKGVEVVDVAGFKWATSGNRLNIEVPDIYSGESKRILVQLKAPADAKRVIDLGKGAFTCDEISKGKTQIFARDFHPSIKVVEDQTVVAHNFDGDVQAKAASVVATRQMEEAYTKYEAGEIAPAQQAAQEAMKTLSSVSGGKAEPQRMRYNDFFNALNSPAANDEENKKDILKKQKETDRNAQQTTPQ